MDFVSRYQASFYYNGNLLDAEIKEDDMKKFLEDNGKILKQLASEHIKKMEDLRKMILLA